MPSEEPTEEEPGIDQRSRVVQADFISSRDRPDGDLGDWAYNLQRAYQLDNYTVIDKSHTGIGWAEPEVPPLSRSPPTSHRSGTCFDVESTEMRDACVRPLAVHLESDVTLHEVRHQRNGYHTDLVFADVDPEAVLERSTMVRSSDPIHDPLQRFRVWWYTYEYGPMTRPKAIEDGKYSDPAKNRRHIDWLVDNGYIAETQTNHLIGVRPPKLADLHAVELKLRDWETALEQAKRANCSDDDDIYSRHMSERALDRFGYADYRWVALDAGAIGNALEHSEVFREAGVGLFAIAEGGTVVKHIDAEHAPRERYTRDRAYAESQIWEQLDVDEHVDDLQGTEEETRSQSPLNAFTDN